MTITERRVLKSISIITADNSHLEVCWANEIVKEGQVIASENHRGAYPSDENGNPDDSVVSEMGRSISVIIGDALSNAQRRIIVLETENIQLKNQLRAALAK